MENQNHISPQQRAVSAVKWSALMEVVSRIASPLIMVILARLLTPKDFGIVATAMIAISFSQMFWDAGLSKALIQTKVSQEAAANIVFWTNVALGLLIYLCLFLSAPLIADFFKSPESAAVLRILGTQIILASLSTVHQALLVRDFNFKGLFWVRLLVAFLPGMFSIPMAVFGYGVWALVTGSIIAQLINLILLWTMSPWRPKFYYDWAQARSIFKFGFWVTLESFGAWLIIWGDNLIVGKFLGVHDLGIYRTAWNLVTVIFGLVLNPFLPVLYPTFCRLQDDLPALKNTFYRVNRIVFALALPMGTGLLLLGPEIATLLFGEKWQGLGFVLGVLGFMNGIAWLVGINAELYRAMGRPDMNTKLIYISLLYYIPAYYLSAQHGLETFTITRLAVAVVATPIHIYLCIKLLGVSPFYIWLEGKPMILAVLAMTAGVSVLKWGILTHVPVYPFLSLGVLIGTGCLIYLGCLWLLDRSFVLTTSSLLKRAAV